MSGPFHSFKLAIFTNVCFLVLILLHSTHVCMYTLQAFCSAKWKRNQQLQRALFFFFCQLYKYSHKWNIMKADEVHLSANTPDRCLLNRSRNVSFQASHLSKLMAPTSYSHIRRGLHAPGCLKRIKSGGKNMLSISQNSICLPARAFKTINKIREHTMATVPLLPPSVSFSFLPPIPSHFVLAHLPVQCRHSVVCLHLLS